MLQLIVFRGVQGMGAGGLMAMAFTVVGDVVSPRARGRYIGLFAGVWAFASVAALPQLHRHTGTEDEDRDHRQMHT